MNQRPNVTLLALLIAIGALAVPCVSWFAVGFRDATRQAEDFETEPWHAAREVALQLAERIRSRLEAVRDSESRRPFYHYQNLYHDPRGASEGASVVPSPLAQGPADPWIYAYFQVDAKGHVTLPTLNDEVAEANSPVDVTEQRAIQKELQPVAADCLLFVREGKRPLVPVPTHMANMASKTKLAQTRIARSQSRLSSVPSDDETASPTQQAQQPTMEVLDPSAYAQNVQAAKVYADIKRGAKDARLQQLERGKSKKEVVIPVGAFQWLTVSLRGVPSLVAVREVRTPDQSLVQGFVISLATINESFKGTAFPVEFTPRPPAGQGEISIAILDTQWRLLVDATKSITEAQTRALAVWHRFFVSFAWGVIAASVAMLCVVGMVWQTDRLARQRSQFAASAAHELRTPLAGLRMFSEMLAEGLGDPTRAKEYARRIADESERLGRVVGNVLEFTRLERGALKVRPEPGNLADAVRESVERQRPAIETLGARLEVSIAEDLPTARFDRDAVGEILQNLLDNAEKHTRSASERTIHVGLRMAATDRAGHAEAKDIALSVTDHGPGVPLEIRHRLFRPFERGNHAEAPAGLGLGLVLVQALARAQGGDVRYDDAPGGGALFTVTFPV